MVSCICIIATVHIVACINPESKEDWAPAMDAAAVVFIFCWSKYRQRNRIQPSNYRPFPHETSLLLYVKIPLQLRSCSIMYMVTAARVQPMDQSIHVQWTFEANQWYQINVRGIVMQMSTYPAACRCRCSYHFYFMGVNSITNAYFYCTSEKSMWNVPIGNQPSLNGSFACVSAVVTAIYLITEL